jgi:hypothetical protein
MLKYLCVARSLQYSAVVIYKILLQQPSELNSAHIHFDANREERNNILPPVHSTTTDRNRRGLNTRNLKCVTQLQILNNMLPRYRNSRKTHDKTVTFRENARQIVINFFCKT